MEGVIKKKCGTCQEETIHSLIRGEGCCATVCLKCATRINAQTSIVIGDAECHFNTERVVTATSRLQP